MKKSHLILTALYSAVLSLCVLTGCSNDDDSGLPSSEASSPLSKGIYDDSPEAYEKLLDPNYTGITRPDDAYTYKMTPMLGPYAEIKAEKGWSAIDELNVIPEETLQALSTRALIQAVMDYPGAALRLFENYNNSLETKEHLLIISANQELIKRDDAAKELIEDLKPICKLANTGQWNIQTLFMMIGQDQILTNLTTDETRDLIGCLRPIISIAGASSLPVFADLRMMEGFILLGKVLIQNNYEPFICYLDSHQDLRDIIQTLEFEKDSYSSNDMLEWVKFADDFLKD